VTTRTDDIGVWQLLGTITPKQKEWLKFPTTATGANATLRATYICSDWSKLNSYLLIRPRYQTFNSNQVGQAIRIYPEPLGNLFEIPIPPDFLERSVYFRDFEVRKVLRWRRRIGVTPDAILDVKLEELWG
jgi:hypothetical protein